MEAKTEQGSTATRAKGKRAMSEETKAKIAQSTKARWLRRKAARASEVAFVSTIPVREIPPSEDEMTLPTRDFFRRESQSTPHQSDPVGAFNCWIEHATPAELEEAEPKLEEAALSHYGHGYQWRLGMGERLYKHREVVKKRKSRDWTKWVTDRLGLARTSAYGYVREWLEEYGHGPDEHNQPDQPNPQADAIKDAIAKARQNRSGRRRAPAAPEPSDHVRVSWPEIFATREECDRFKEERERDGDRVYQICLAALHQVIAKAEPESETDPVPVRALLEGDPSEEEPNVSACN